MSGSENNSEPGPDAAVGVIAAARLRLTEALVATGAEDRVAFRLVYRLTSSKLFGICLRICGSRQAAEDVMQEVYLTVWRRAGAYDPGRSSPITWLATIARNRSIDWRRSHPTATQAPAVDAPEPVDPSASAVDLMMFDEADRALHLCLNTLEEGQREAFRAAFFEGLSYGELARRASIPLGTMKSRMRRGLARLKECLGDD